MFFPFASWYVTESGLLPEPPRNEDVIDRNPLPLKRPVKIKTDLSSERFPQAVTPEAKAQQARREEREAILEEHGILEPGSGCWSNPKTG